MLLFNRRLVALPFHSGSKSGETSLRLTTEEQNAIRKVIYEADPEAQVWLFGSRVNDQAKGGDIDLLILSKK